MKWHTGRVRGGKCNQCGEKLDAYTAFRHDASPKPGDLTMCLRCGLCYSFTETLELEPLSAEQFSALPEGTRAELTLLLLLRAQVSPGASEK